MKAQRLRQKLLPLLLLLTLSAAAHSATRAVPNPVPLVNNPLVPDAVAPGSQGFTLTVNGTGFVSSSAVNWNGSPLATTFVNASQVTAVVPAVDVAVAGTASVTVVNPAPGGGNSNQVDFTIRARFTASSFGSSVFRVGNEPEGTFTADLNKDGHIDLVTPLGQDSAVAISIGEGNGAFLDPVLYPVAGFAGGIAIGDFNHDGNLDVATSTASDSDGAVSVLLGNGDGTFQKHQDFSVGTIFVALLTAGDFNGDGNLDLAVVLSQGSIAVLIGNGDGSFQSHVDYPIGTDRAFAIATGDFNRDGKLDLAVTAFDGAVFVMLGNGDGTFGSATKWLTQSGSFGLVVADFNGDGYLDLAAQSSFGWLSILLGNGDGTFGAHVDYAVQRSFYGLATADMNGDGKLDLIVPTYHPGRIVSLLLGRGDGTFFKRSDFPTSESDGSVPIGIAVGDFDEDGRLDIATANGHTLSILPQVTSVLSRTYVKFGNVKVGDSAKIKVALSNIGNVSFDITKIALEGTSKVAYSETSNCGKKLAPGGSCKITIVFTPLSPIPYRKARVKVNDSIADQKVYLVGTGVK